MRLARDGELRQVTHDHTVVAALIESGQLTPDEARSHAHRNLLNRALTPGVVADEAVLGWLEAAGLEGRVVEHLGGGELTVTIWVGRQPAERIREVA